METQGLLPDKFFLDKNFFPLRDYIFKKLRYNDYGDEMEKVKVGDFKDIIFDVLDLLKPTYEQVKNKI